MHVGFLARSVRDIGLALSIASGPDGEDWHAVPVPPPEPPASRVAPLPRLRVGVLAERGFGLVDAEVASTVRRAAEALAEAGADVDEATIPALEQTDWNVLTMILYSVGGGPYLDRVIAGRHDQLHPALQRRLSVRPTSLDDYVAAEEAVEELRRDLAVFFSAHDLLLCPTGLVAAHGHDADEVEIAGERVAPRTAMRATIPFDLSGSPALSVPFGRGESGLPIGVQLVGRDFDEASVLSGGIGLELARG
jgi:aspartyl-tRNA(Asn)/glutamyl-tRNA(Gln) amidotransferase subunit A